MYAAGVAIREHIVDADPLGFRSHDFAQLLIANSAIISTCSTDGLPKFLTFNYDL